MKNPNFFYLTPSLRQSVILHAGIGLFFYGLTFIQMTRPLSPKEVDIQVVENPHTSKVPAQASPIQKKVNLPSKSRAVFGLSRRSLSSTAGVDVKHGNTTAKAPDQNILQPSDTDSLPTPTEDYLVTEMPILEAEVRIPYPASAKKKGIEGAVILDLLIDSEGRVREAKEIQSPDPSLGEAALTAAKNFRFKPAKIQDKPTAVRIRYSYRFIIER